MLDKGSGVVLLNKSDYVDKISEIFDDQSKFKVLEPVSSNDNTAKIKLRVQKRLLDVIQVDLVPRWIYNEIRPTGSQRRRMYNLSKTQKESTSLRPILSMTGSSVMNLAGVSWPITTCVGAVFVTLHFRFV